MANIWGESRGEDADARQLPPPYQVPSPRGVGGSLQSHFCHVLAMALGKTQTPLICTAGTKRPTLPTASRPTGP